MKYSKMFVESIPNAYKIHVVETTVIVAPVDASDT